MHPKVTDAAKRIAAAAKRAEIHWGRPVFSAEDAQVCLEMGARFMAHSADITLIKKGLENIQAEFGPKGFAFTNQLTSAATRPALHAPHLIRNKNGSAVELTSGQLVQ